MKPSVFERVVIDGVPAYIGNCPGPIVAGLTFRVGTADESALERGLSALVAELAAIDADAVEFDVGMTLTSFIARGHAGTVCDALAAACRALPAFDDDDITQLADTLLDEPPQAPTLLATLLGLRWGAHDYGTAVIPPLALLRVDGDQARAWVARHFSRGNAALWSTGPLAADASIPLPAGDRVASPPRAESECATPGWCPNAWLGALFHDAIDCSVVATSSDAALVAMRAFEDELVERLAATRLKWSTPSVRLARWGDDLGYVELSLDTLAHGNDGIECILGSLDDFAELGPDPEELRDAVAAIWSWSTEPANAERVAEMLAADELRSGSARTLDAFLGAVDAVSADEVQAVFTAMRETIVLAIPPDAEIVDPQLALIERANEVALVGKEYRRAEVTGTPYDDARLVVGDEGVTYSSMDERLTICFEDCVAAVAYPDDTLALYDIDGTTIELAANDWRDGEKALAAIGAAVPVEVMVVARRVLGPAPAPTAEDAGEEAT